MADEPKHEQDPTTKPADQMPAQTGKATAPPGPAPAKRSFWETMRLRQPPNQLASAVAAASCVGFILLVWVLLTTGTAESRAVSPTVLPSPGETISSFHSPVALYPT